MKYPESDKLGYKLLAENDINALTKAKLLVARTRYGWRRNLRYNQRNVTKRYVTEIIKEIFGTA